MRYLREPTDLARWGMVSRYHRNVVRTLPPEHALLLHGGERLREGIDLRKLLLLPVPRALKCAAGVCELCKRARSVGTQYAQPPAIFPSLSLYAHAKCLREISAPAERIRDHEDGDLDVTLDVLARLAKVVKLLACRTPSLLVGDTPYYVEKSHPLLRYTWTAEGVEGLTLEQCKEEGRVRELQMQEDEARCAAVIERLAPRLREQDAAVAAV